MKSTIISIVPFGSDEFKPGIYPGIFKILPSKDEIPELLVIGESICHIEIDETRSITTKFSSSDIAKSIVNDYLTSNLGYSIEEESSPGIFWKEGEHDLSSVFLNFSDDLALAKERQHNWFVKLVRLADDDWEKTRQHRSITDMQRGAARILKLDRPWVIKPTIKDTIKCMACQSSISPDAIVCPSCKLILNIEKWKTLKFAEV